MTILDLFLKQSLPKERSSWCLIQSPVEYRFNAGAYKGRLFMIREVDYVINEILLVVLTSGVLFALLRGDGTSSTHAEGMVLDTCARGGRFCITRNHVILCGLILSDL